MPKKARTTLYIDSEVLKEARELGFNISKLCENCLKEAIRRMGETKTQTMTNGGYIDTRSVSQQPIVAGPRRFKSSFKFPMLNILI